MFVVPKHHRKYIVIAKTHFLDETGKTVKDDITDLKKELIECEKLTREMYTIFDKWTQKLCSERPLFADYFKANVSKYSMLCQYFSSTGLMKAKVPGQNQCSSIANKFCDDYLVKPETYTKAEIDKRKKELTRKNNIYKYGKRLTKCFLDSGYLNYKVLQALPYSSMEDYYEKHFYSNKSVNNLLFEGKCFFGPEGILALKELTKGTLDYELYPVVVSWLNRCFNYEKFSGKKSGPYTPYVFCHELGINVCIYCNINYTYTIDHGRKLKEEALSGTVLKSALPLDSGKTLVARPELDHFFPKSKYPMFQMSFDNLIPSCSICNGKIKRDMLMSTKQYIHPYQDEMPEMNFYLETDDKIKIRYGGDGVLGDKIRNTIRFFKTSEVYGYLQEQIKDILEKKNVYTPEYIEELEALIPEEKRKTNREQIMKDLLGYVEEDRVMNTSMGKMRRDLVSVILKAYS